MQTLEQVSKITEAVAARQEAEEARRKKLLPAQRDAEDQAIFEANARKEFEKHRKRVLRMGTPMFKRESWTLDAFAWLLAGSNPKDNAEVFLPVDVFTTAAEKQRDYLSILESCVGLRLHPVNPHEPLKSQRFPAGELVTIAVEKNLGLVQPLVSVLNAVRPLKMATARPIAALPKDQRSLVDKKKAWQAIADNLCKEIESAAAKGQIPPFEREPLRWSMQTLFDIASSQYAQKFGENMPVQLPAYRRYLNDEHGWKSSRGYQDPNAAKELEGLFKI